MMRWVIALALVLALATVAAAAAVSERERFRDALDLVESGLGIDLEQARASLDDYPLFPYLEYYELRRRLSELDPAQVEAFERARQELPIAGRLRYAWLLEAGRRGDWEGFLQLDRGQQGAALACYRLSAQRAVDAVDADWRARAMELWLVGHSQPEACDPVFRMLQETGYLDDDAIWQRALLAMEAGNAGLVRHLSRALEGEYAQWANHWLRVASDPARALADPEFPLQGELAKNIVRQGLRLLGRDRADLALERLAALGAKSELLSDDELLDMQRELALWGAYSHHAQALEWLEALPAAAVDDEVQEWRAVLALARQDWPRLLNALDALPAERRQDARWQYWRAHALEHMDHPERAASIYAALAEQRQYYGFLAADRLGREYRMNPEQVAVSEQKLEELALRPGFVRARELLEVGLKTDARREWQVAVGELGAQEQALAAVLALRWNWHDQAIATANAAGLRDALALRFPTPYRDEIERYSGEFGLDPSLTYALLRKESTFRTDAVSGAGALGLMQLMPRTARELAARYDAELPSPQALFEPELNLALGSAYLRELLDRYQGNVVFATAAYNAGAARVAEWRARYPELPPAIWIETISYRETRDYVKSILAFHAVFDWQLEKEQRPLSRLLSAVEGLAQCGDEAEGYC